MKPAGVTPHPILLGKWRRLVILAGRAASTGRQTTSSAYVGTDEDEEEDPAAQRRYASADADEENVDLI